MKMIIVVMMLYNGKDGGNGDNSDNMVKGVCAQIT